MQNKVKILKFEMLVLRLKFEILNVEFYSTILNNSSNKQGLVPFIIGTYPDGSYKFCLHTFCDSTIP